MTLNVSKIYLGPKAWTFSLDHFQGPKPCIYSSKPPSFIEIHNHRPIIPLEGHVWLFKASFLALDG
jgi:hypothetical protein